MSYSRAFIYNIALNCLGLSATVQNVNQTDAAATVLNNFYEMARNQVLKDFDWNFANAYRELASTGNTPENPKYLYEFDYPNDCIQAREVLDSMGNSVKFSIASTLSGQQVIYANILPAKLRYTRIVTKEAFFSADFILALGTYLAGLCALAITGSQEKEKLNFQKYQFMLNKAKYLNASEGVSITEKELLSTWIDER